ncbi:L-type lectin-domain containing receptor kinase SIT2-like [Cryptomeria japonica]|uniref:L-type lectin-domain containing receptor kinase SIT2-like n=1 Tax=Cryptomeria japonica TaxID=3369 RepID=UPI0027DA6954|nr:L-type lectin-domain containing receptor kinase SIT2-like [Cryptomeria japonica]
MFRESSDAVKEFIAEISSLGRLQHRNIVQIRGYCRRGTNLFIVYDYMANGSLDMMIFGKRKSVLAWAQSNVLLDFNLNGKLGDFGLARLYEHTENPPTTRVVGTLGYIAPELLHTGKAAPSVDVFSFGILMLEVACGRRPVDPSLDPSQMVMLDWVRDLHAEGRLMDAADPSLAGGYVEDEMKKVLKLGLLCCNSQPEDRGTSVKYASVFMQGRHVYAEQRHVCVFQYTAYWGEHPFPRLTDPREPIEGDDGGDGDDSGDGGGRGRQRSFDYIGIKMNDPSASTASPPSGSTGSCSSSGSTNILPVDVLVLESCIDDVLYSLTDKGLRCKLLESGMKLRDIVQPVASNFLKLFESNISDGAKMISD